MDERTDETIIHANGRADEMTEDENISEEPAAFVVPPPALAGAYAVPPVMMDTSAPPPTGEEPAMRPSESDRPSADINQTTSQIEETRAEMEDTIDAIKEKLNPSRLVAQVRESLRDTVVEKAGHRIEDARDKVKEVANRTVDSAKHLFDRAGAGAAGDTQSAALPAGGPANGMAGTMKGFGAGMLNVVRQNPLPMAMMGIGAIWLAASVRRSHSSLSDECFESPGAGANGSNAQSPSENIGAKVGDMAGTVTQKVSQLGSKTQDQALKVKDGVARTMDERPLAAGAIALLLGMAAGFIVPETPKENELMGGTRDRLASQAQRSMKEAISTKVDEVAHGLAERVENVTHEFLGT